MKRGLKKDSGRQILYVTENDAISVGKLKDGRIACSYNLEQTSTSGRDTWLSRESILFSRDDARWLAREILRVLVEPEHDQKKGNTS